jgi:hypothetical protein
MFVKVDGSNGAVLAYPAVIAKKIASFVRTVFEIGRGIPRQRATAVLVDELAAGRLNTKLSCIEGHQNVIRPPFIEFRAPHRDRQASAMEGAAEKHMAQLQHNMWVYFSKLDINGGPMLPSEPASQLASLTLQR